MEKLVSNWCKSKPLPESYIFPPETRPGKLLVPICNTIPVIDLSKAEGQNRTDIIQQILKASQEFGFFQVVNHGIPKNLMNESMDVFKEVFQMPAEEKAILYSDDPKKSCRLLTSSPNYDWEEIHVWRDNLRHPCHPLEESIKLWPEKPTRYREVVSTYSIEAKKLGLRILELVSEGLGLESGYFGDKLSEALSISVNHYPTCPDPSLTLGLSKHCDANLITILHQGDVSGLQVFKDGEWIGVEPLHNAIVINIGHQLQIISNNKLKSAEHRVVTNSKVARTTAAFFIGPSDDSIIEPAKSLTNHACNPPLYRAFEYKEFILNFYSMMGYDELSLKPFKL
ncbi:hyoscyamine 6-dioxygenase-like [Durio zibethinus]|uniref:Hyoscyamine 6-dioxygenase-like n=1 Tax=Durio zibethinus TaxID=66656 RepID=A0A6P5XHE2_DURZI|nr:hyoscyamine 6-dioxygenase-like [Durio zibethinus]